MLVAGPVNCIECCVGGEIVIRSREIIISLCLRDVKLYLDCICVVLYPSLHEDFLQLGRDQPVCLEGLEYTMTLSESRVYLAEEKGKTFYIASIAVFAYLRRGELIKEAVVPWSGAQQKEEGQLSMLSR